MDSRDRIARPGTKAPASPSQNRGQPIQLPRGQIHTEYGYLVQAGLELPDRRTLRTHSGYPAISGYRAVYDPGWSLRLCGGGLAGRG
jgi:hypothetical protein